MRRIKNPRKNALVNQMQFRKPQAQVRKWFEERDIPIVSEIWIYPIYPFGWDAVLAAWDRVWILNCDRGKIVVKDIQPVQGFRPNGTLITS